MILIQPLECQAAPPGGLRERSTAPIAEPMNGQVY